MWVLVMMRGRVQLVDATVPVPTLDVSGVEGSSGERVTGIEPAWPAWKAGALPLSYTRVACPQSVSVGVATAA